MTELFPEEQINWDTFEVEDPQAREYTPPAEPTPESPDDAASEDADTADDERPRDPETGRFVAAEDETAPEGEPEPAAEPADPLVAEYLAKYNGDVDAAVKAAAHQTSLIGRQGSELKELREQLSELVEAMQQQAQRPVFTPSHDVESLIANEGLLAAAERTAQAGDWDAHNRVISEWRQVDPDTAGMYQLAKQTQFEAAQAQQRAAELAQQQSKAQQGNALETAVARLRAEIPDFDSLSDAIAAEADEAAKLAGKPVFTPMIESGDPNQIYFALRTLALSARTRQAGFVEQQAAQLARTAAAETQRAKAEAMVSSADATGPEPPQPQSYDEEFLEQLEAEDKPRNDGWQIAGH